MPTCKVVRITSNHRYFRRFTQLGPSPAELHLSKQPISVAKAKARKTWFRSMRIILMIKKIIGLLVTLIGRP